MTRSSSISDALGSVEAAQNKANTENLKRYRKGLNTLTGGLDASRQYLNQGAGFIQQALTDLKDAGRRESRVIAEKGQQAHAKTQQSAINRGIANTTITDALHRGVDQDVRNARQDLLEKLASVRSGIHLQQANQSNIMGHNERSGAGEIASFIAARNDVAPNLPLYADLTRAAASDTSGVQRVGTVTHWPATDAFGRPTNGVNVSGGALGSNATVAPAAVPTPGVVSQALGVTSSPTSISSALNTPSVPSTVMSQAGYAPGSISIKPGKPGTGLPLNAVRDQNGQIVYYR